ncbi:hypothetical protein [Bradyrhizobium ottawaense]
MRRLAFVIALLAVASAGISASFAAVHHAKSLTFAEALCSGARVDGEALAARRLATMSDAAADRSRRDITSHPSTGQMRRWPDQA